MMMRCNIGLCFLIICLFSSGCGYQVGVRAMTHPQIKSIAVAPVKNNTLEPLAADVLRMQLSGEIQRDGALKLKRVSSADCVIYAEIISVKNKTVREDSYDNALTYRPAEFQITVEVEYSVQIPGSGTPLIEKRKVSGSALYEILADPAVARATALKFACFHASENIVRSVTEGW